MLSSDWSPRGPGIALGERFLSLDDLLDRAARAATALAELGVREGDSVAILTRNDIAFYEVWAAAMILGACPVPLNFHSRRDEIEAMLLDCDARVVVAHRDLFNALLPGGSPGDPPLIVIDTPAESGASVADAVRGPQLPEAVLDWDALVAQSAPLPGGLRTGGSSLMYSGGSTGRPKGIRRFPRSAERAALYSRAANPVYGIEAGMRTVVCSPIYHSGPLYHSTAAMLAGGTLILQPRFDAAELLSLVERHRATNLMMVPTMFVRLLKLPEEVRHHYDLSSLQHVVHGAAPCPPSIKRQMIKWWGPILHEYYGCTESGIITAATSAEWLARPGTVGRPILGATIQIYRADGTLAAPGEEGEIYVHNEGSADFTYEHLQSERLGIERDGLITCGDIGRMDVEGYLYLLDRKRDMVISGGVNIFPAEIEAELMQIPELTDCAVFGVPDPDYGEVLAAVVTVRPDTDITTETIRTFLAGRLGGLKLPRHVRIAPSLPRDESGKIKKRLLRDPYWQGLNRSI
jgi:long-chain acyl-CoA synthetase